MREIVDAAGVTKPVLYYYFKNGQPVEDQGEDARQTRAVDLCAPVAELFLQDEVRPMRRSILQRLSSGPK